jgi:hypothetical protein
MTQLTVPHYREQYFLIPIVHRVDHVGQLTTTSLGLGEAKTDVEVRIKDRKHF